MKIAYRLSFLLLISLLFFGCGEPVRRGVDTVPGDDEEDLNADLATADHRLQGVPEAFWPRTVEQHNCQAGDAAGGIQ